jgi:hypothetical protein
VTIVMRDLPQPTAIVGAHITLWGVPSEPSHDDERKKICFGPFCFGEVENPETHEMEVPPHSTSWPRRPFLSNPADCTPSSLPAEIRADSWQEQGTFYKKQLTVPGPEGCENLSFHPSFTWQPDNQRAGAPSGYSFDLHVPVDRNPDGFAVPPVKKVVATLPAGTVVSPGGSDGIAVCTSQQAGMDNAAKQACPPPSAVGDAYLETPLLPGRLQGTLYLAKPHDNPFNSLYAFYLMFEGFGTRIKLAGRVDVDPQTGQITSTFEGNPQQPFENLHIHFGGGTRALLANPTSCGQKSMTMRMDSWSGQSSTTSSSFTIDQGCGHGFAPQLDAGTKNPVAGEYSPFVLKLTRPEQDQILNTLDFTLAPGQLAKLKGVPYCPESSLAAISSLEGTGAGELASPHCPAASQVGTATVAAGPGPTPLYTSGRIYLAGPYKGAPLSLAVVTPAISGPYDLGTVVVRNALRVDPTTAQVESVSDPLPTIVYGVPLAIREVRVNLDRAGFALNPTNCEPLAVRGLISSIEGMSALVSSRYQVGECGALGFGPQLALSLDGGTRRGQNPALTAVLRAPRGQANIAKTSVLLPKSEFIDNAHIDNPCTRVQFDANACPKKSILGIARAYTPLLDKPLEGPVYFRSNGGDRELPDLVADLRGQIHVTLVGFIDAVVKKGTESSRIRTRFQNIPDAPVSKFVLKLKGGDSGLFENSRNLCKHPGRADVRMDAQNGKLRDFVAPVTSKCGAKGPKRRG